MENYLTAPYSHPYLLDLFPSYDYRTPTRPWEINCRNNDGIRNCAWQMKSFHYWWIGEKCFKTGEIGLSINIDNLPFCIHTDNRRDNGHSFASLNSIYKLFTREKFPLIIASAFIPYFPCSAEIPRCEGREVAKAIDMLAGLLSPSGVLIGAIMDESGPLHEGRSLKESSHFVHAWTVRQFSRSILDNLDGSLWIIEEFDTFKNDMAFNLVLRKK